MPTRTKARKKVARKKVVQKKVSKLVAKKPVEGAAPPQEEVKPPEGQSTEPGKLAKRQLHFPVNPGGTPGAPILSEATRKELLAAAGTSADQASENFPVLVPEDIAAIEPVTYEGEHLPPLNGETWVVLGPDPSVPNRYVGSIAAVIDPIPISRDENGVEYTDPDAQLTVRERSQGARLQIPLSSVVKISLSGRAGVWSIP